MTNRSPYNSREVQWLYRGLIFLILLWVSAILFTHLFAEFYLKDRISEAFSAANGYKIQLVISKIDVDLFPPKIVLKDVALAPGMQTVESKPDYPILNSGIEKISVSGIEIWTWMITGNIIIKNAEVVGLDFHLYPKKLERFTSGQSSDSEKLIKIKSISVSETFLKLYREDFTSIETQLHNIDLQLTDLGLTPDSGALTDRFGQLDFQIDSVVHETGNEYYVIKGQCIAFNSNSGDFSITEFFVDPQLSPKVLPSQVGHEIDHYEMHSGPITCHGFDLNEWFSNKHLVARNIIADKFEMEISRDKNHADGPRNESAMLNTQFANLPFGVSIDSFIWRDGYIGYREWADGRDSAGYVFFESINAVMTGIQNRNRDEPIKAEASTMFLNESKLSVNFQFLLNEQGTQRVNGSLEQIDLKKLNPILIPLVLVQLDEGYLHSLEFDFQMNQTQSKGSVLCIYEDLSVSILENVSKDQTIGNSIASFLGNALQVRSSNVGDNPTLGEIAFEREKGQTDVNYWWKSVRSGLQDLIMRI